MLNPNLTVDSFGTIFFYLLQKKKNENPLNYQNQNSRKSEIKISTD